MSKLSPKQEKFCREYVLNGENASQAYIKAGYSENGARASASALLTIPNIKDYVAKLRKETSEAFKVDQKWLFDRYKALHDKHEEMTPAVAKGSLDSIAKMFGLNEAEKVEFSGSITGSFADNIKKLNDK